MANTRRLLIDAARTPLFGADKHVFERLLIDLHNAEDEAMSALQERQQAFQNFIGFISAHKAQVCGSYLDDIILEYISNV